MTPEQIIALLERTAEGFDATAVPLPGVHDDYLNGQGAAYAAAATRLRDVIEQIRTGAPAVEPADPGPMVLDKGQLRPATPEEIAAMQTWQATEGARLNAEQAAVERSLYGYNGEGR